MKTGSTSSYRDLDILVDTINRSRSRSNSRDLNLDLDVVIDPITRSRSRYPVIMDLVMFKHIHFCECKLKPSERFYLRVTFQCLLTWRIMGASLAM